MFNPVHLHPRILTPTQLSQIKAVALTETKTIIPTFNMSSNDNTSSLKAAIDTATGYVQSGIAAVTGSAGDQVRIQLNLPFSKPF